MHNDSFHNQTPTPMRTTYRAYALSFLLFICFTHTHAQSLVKLWDKRFGGSNDEYLNLMTPTADGGYLLGGESVSGADGDKTEASRGNYDCWVVKIDANGSKQWDKRFGGSSDDILRAITPTADGGYLLGATSASGADGDKTEAGRGNWDYWVVKIDANGTKQWDKRFGGSSADYLNAMTPTADGGYLLGGESFSGAGDDKSEVSRGDFDYWVVKIAADGSKQWDKRFGGSSYDEIRSMTPTADGGYLLAGYSFSQAGGDKTEANRGIIDYWVVKIAANGSKQWDKRFGGSSDDVLRSMTPTADGGYLLGGVSFSGADGDKTEASRGGYDYWVVKIDGNGSKQWDKRFGGTTDDYLYALTPTADGGYLLGGYSYSGADGDKTEASRGNADYWVVKIGCPSVSLNFAPICLQGNPLNLSVSGGDLYAWKGPNGFKSNSATPTKAKTVAKDEGIYSVTATGNTGCTVTSTIRVYYGVGNVTATSNSPVCKGGTIQLSATSEFGASYKWAKGSTVYTGQNPSILNAKTSDGGLYTVFITGNNGCIVKKEVLVTVSPVPCVAPRLATDETEEIDMQVNAYPNPVTNTLTVEVTLKETSKLSLQLFNSMGKESGTWQLNDESTVHKTELNMSELQGGVYVLQAQAGKQKVVKRVVKIQD